MHWVGDGFAVHGLFGPNTVGARLSPFVLMDYAAPRHYEPATEPRGVDQHPHRGFETVTVVYQGELEHRDSAGHSGSIGPGDVQWMTAASGVVHEEKHSAAFTQRGGTMEMAQLWVNLPAAHKMDAPRYQTLLKASIPVVQLPNNAGTVRVIAGDFHTTHGAARTVTPVILWDLVLNDGATADLPAPDGFTFNLFVRSGTLVVGSTVASPGTVASSGTAASPGTVAAAGTLVVMDRAGSGVRVTAQGPCSALILGGQPLNEPVASYGPFVMNTPAEVQQAIADYRAGRMGAL